VEVWNVRMLLDHDKKQRPERSALVNQELAKYKIDIAALNETRRGTTVLAKSRRRITRYSIAYSK